MHIRIIGEKLIMKKTKEIKEIKEIFLEFTGIDYFNRPVFKQVDQNNFYGSINKVYPWNDNGDSKISDIKSEDLVYFGKKFECEPMGDPCPENEKWIILQ